MKMRRRVDGIASLFLSCGILAAATSCGDNLEPSPAGIEEYYPDLPAPTGQAQASFAGAITQSNASELIVGPAATGLVGDYFIRNDKARFVISAPTRVIGVVPQGGNVIDAVLADNTGQLNVDHFGELGLLYLLGRTCDHNRIEIVRDGSAGGAAVLRAHGKSGNNDFINIRGIGILPVEAEVDPTFDDGVECATTYVLEPGSATLSVSFTLYNPTTAEVAGPLGTLSDTGGQVESWGEGRGFERLSVTSITAITDPAPLDFVVYQGPGVSYGLFPRHAQADVVNSAFLIAGVSILLMGNDELLDILNRDSYFLRMPAMTGNLQQLDFIVGRDVEDVDTAVRASRGDATTEIAGTVLWADGDPAMAARVGVYADGNGNGAIDDDEAIVSYMDVTATGQFSGRVPASGGFLVRAEVQNVGRSPTMPAGPVVAMTIPNPVTIDFTVEDVDTGNPIPTRITVIGEHAAFPDQRLFEVYDRVSGVIRVLHASHGTSTDIGAGADPAIVVPAGSHIRIVASRGTEWSVAEQELTATADMQISLELKHVIPTPGYVSSEWHVHQINSPDSPVGPEDRVASALAGGIELWAVTDHDFVTDLQPLVDEMGATEQTAVLAGIEVTPFAYGHFNAWPVVPVENDPSRGGIDWATGGIAGFNMLPGEIFDAMRTRGAEIVQINHPRSISNLGEFQSFFDRAVLKYDYAGRTIFGDFANSTIGNEALRLPEQTLWNDSFNALEVWNGGHGSGGSLVDTNGDGRLELDSFDLNLRDLFNMLSFGLPITPMGNSDTHTLIADPMGMPRTMVAVNDDSPTGIAGGATASDAQMTLAGASVRDVVLTNGPMISVLVDGQPAIGRVVDGSGGVTMSVTIIAPDWAEFDTLEVFANSTPEVPLVGSDSTLTPVRCYTTRSIAALDPLDPCARAPMAAATMNVTSENLGGGYTRHRAAITISLQAADIDTRAGATGQDAWVVLRVTGNRAIYPVIVSGVITEANLPGLVTGNQADVDAATIGHGVGAAAMTGAILVDFDGNGYRAPFAP